ncbi:MAG: CRISPR-associated helicase/endonuclease Cas3 [Candidatus Competibacteraceae bacterium]|nr:CRISPR-associated helicase/endonuclease Cas3 [Candidatus Competibacteraceae bacterium]
MDQRLFRYWGKARSDNEDGPQWHLLVYHSLDVAAVADCWLQKDRALRDLLVRAANLDFEPLRAWLLFFIGLHDLGKFDVRFQWKAPHAARHLQPDFEKQHNLDEQFNHGAAGYVWFTKESQDYGFNEYNYDAIDWMKAVASHHGSSSDKKLQTKGFAAPSVIAHDNQARIAWIETLRDLYLKPIGIASGETPPAIDNNLLAGLCSVADWIGSNTGEHGEYFCYETEQTDDLADYLKSRHNIAERALHDFGIYRPALVQGGMRIFPNLTPRGVQTLVDQIPVEPGLTLIEAPTGSGKTEAALAYASHLLAKGFADSLIFALPTQATSNAMLNRFIQNGIGPSLFTNTVQDIVLAHGKARFNQDFEQLKATARQRTAQGREEALSQCSEWLAASRKRVFLGQIGICTIDQVLLSVLPIRHNFVRTLGVRKSVLIIDEIHAYDWYMYGLLTMLLKEQSKAGGSVVLLSATLPEAIKECLLNAWQSGASPEVSEAYPQVLHAGNMPTCLDMGSAPTPSVRTVHFKLETSEDVLPDEDLIEQIIEAAKKGGKIAIVCNLVNDAQILWQRLATELHARNLSISLDIFHARFRFRDRQNIESQVLCNYGKSAAPGGRILVATQVVEQSLDLDFDWLVTQICPVDLLFQRLGRLHRHARPRPLGETTQCTVLVPDSDDYGLHAVLYGAKTERKMLLNRRVLWRTHRLLEREKKAVFPLAFRDWIKKVYQEDAWPDEPIDIQQEYQQFSEALDGKYYSGQWLAKQALNFPDDEEHAAAMTRDGEMNLMVFVFQRHHGKQCFLDGTQFDELDDWQWQEELNLNGIPVPSSWQKDLQENPDPKDTTIKRYFLEMSPVLVDQWSTSSDQYEYIYNRSMGLRRIARDGKPGG